MCSRVKAYVAYYHLVFVQRVALAALIVAQCAGQVLRTISMLSVAPVVLTDSAKDAELNV